MPWELNSTEPIYTQIINRLQMDIVSGNYKPGEKLPSVREIAAEASVNPNTMQKAFAELERIGLVYTQRTNGRFITEDVDLILAQKKALAEKESKRYLTSMNHLGYDKAGAINFISELAD